MTKSQTSKIRRGMAWMALGVLALAALGSVQAEDPAHEHVDTPKNPAWVKTVDLSSVPDIPVRPVGSGICENALCDGSDNDKCFETCGNKATANDIYGCPAEKQWALTFDDGPSIHTNELLEILDKHKVKASFCVMGAHAEKFPDTLKRAYDAGHQIVSHTYSHAHLMSLTNEEIIAEVKATEEVIQKATGARPRYIRPPYGEADDRVKAVLKAMGYKVLMWNVDPTDYNVYMKPDAPELIRSVFDKASDGVDQGLNPHKDVGFISLQHDLYPESIGQVPHVIENLQKKGYKFSTAAECMGDHEPHDSVKAPVIAQAVPQDQLSNGHPETTMSSSTSAPLVQAASEAASHRIPLILGAVTGLMACGLFM